MLPLLAAGDRGDGWSADSVVGCDSTVNLSGCGSSSNVSHGVGSKFGVVMALAVGDVHPPVRKRMGRVLFRSHPFKVLRQVIELVAVAVIARFSRLGRSVEGSENQPMSLRAERLAADRNRGLQVVSYNALAQDPATLDLLPAALAWNHSSHGSQAAKRGSLVSIEAGDRFPDFNCGRILLSHRRLLEGAWSELRQAFARPADRFVSEEFYHA